MINTVVLATVLQFFGTGVLALFSFYGIKISKNNDAYIEGMQKVEISLKWLRASQVALVALLVGIVLSGWASLASAYEQPRPDAKFVYTLYRSSAVVGGASWRLHVATFDAVDSAEYNRDNCEISKKLYQASPGVTVTYWCERGYFSKK